MRRLAVRVHLWGGLLTGPLLLILGYRADIRHMFNGWVLLRGVCEVFAVVNFVLALVPLWFGTSVAAREIVKERSVYARERMVNLGLFPYVGSKLFALSCIVSLQCIMLFVTLKIAHYLGLMYLPGLLAGLGQLLTMILTGMVGIGLGLLVSALVKTSETATSMCR